MMRGTHVFLFLLLLTLLTGCASLDVHVEIANPQIIETETDRVLLRDRLPIVQGMTGESIRATYRNLANLHLKYLESLAKDYEKKAADPANSGLAGVYRIAAQTLTSQTRQDKVRALYETEASSIISIHGDLLAATADSARVARLRQWDARNRDFFRRIDDSKSEDLRSAQAQALAISDATHQASQTHTVDLRDKLIGDFSIATSPFAHALVKADNKTWAPYFDHSFARGQWGRMDVAVKMESRGVFTFKGVTFDPSTVAKVAAKGLSQAVQFTSQMLGVPTAARQNVTGDAAAAAKSSGELNTLQEQVETADATIADRNAALIELAMKIVAEQPSLTGDDLLKFQKAIAGITATYTGVKQRLTQ